MNPYFYALETRWMGFDRFYKVFVQTGLLCGARIGGQFYDRDSAYRQLVAPAQIFAPLMVGVADRYVRKREQEENEYDRLIPDSAEFLKRHPANFQIRMDSVRQVIFRNKRSWWTAKNHGRMDLLVYPRQRTSFVLVQNPPEQVASMLQSFGIDTCLLP